MSDGQRPGHTDEQRPTAGRRVRGPGAAGHAVHPPAAVAASAQAAATGTAGRQPAETRARYDADQTVAAFAARLTDGGDLTWPVSYTRPWNPRTSRCGSANATEAGFRRAH